jgi:maleate cis-trans isomerase
VGTREERLGANEALFREVNERVAEVAEKFIADESSDRVDFSCECGSAACTQQIAMTMVEYETVRAEPTRFAVIPGHEMPEIERVVARHPNYLVVEKQDPDAEEVARETDPRT